MAKNGTPSDKNAGGQGKKTGQALAGASKSSAADPLTQNTAGLDASSSQKDKTTGTDEKADTNLDAGSAAAPVSGISAGAFAPKSQEEANRRAIDSMTDRVSHGYELAVQSGIRIAVTAKNDGFRRAGRVFGTVPTELLVGDLSLEQFKQLDWEVRHAKGLTVERLDAAQEAEGE